MTRNLAFVAMLLVAVVGSATEMKPAASPVLVELFTSEGCSSCPPADALLEKLDKANQPGAPGVIVLSEHVDYWNHIGWKDPFSSGAFTERQQAYARRFRLDSVYTPEMVVDGEAEFVGSNVSEAKRAIGNAQTTPKLAVSIGAVSSAGKVLIQIQQATGMKKGNANVFLAVASDSASSQVTSGENHGRKLQHVAVVRSLRQIGQLHPGSSFEQEVSIPAASSLHGPARLIAFVQESGQGKVLGAAVRLLD